jgi:hypothetical protein
LFNVPAPWLASDFDSYFPSVVAAVAALGVLVGIHALRHPERGFPDLIAGTYLVPK